MVVFWIVAPCSLVELYRRFIAASIIIALMLEAASTSEASVNVCKTTQRNNPEDCDLRTRHRENLKSHQVSPRL
jgi:hypothetical protein